jgi:hypothetical protein
MAELVSLSHWGMHQIEISPPTDEEFDAMVRDHERNHAIPLRLKAIERWIMKVQARSEDRRNKPDVRRSKGGEKFIAMTTDLDATLKHCATVMRKFSAGEFELAQSSLRDLESRVKEIHSRVTRTQTKTRAQGRPKGAGPKAKLLPQIEALIAENYSPLDAAKIVLRENGELVGLAERAKYLLRVRRGRKNKT